MFLACWLNPDILSLIITEQHKSEQQWHHKLVYRKCPEHWSENLSFSN